MRRNSKADAEAVLKELQSKEDGSVRIFAVAEH